MSVNYVPSWWQAPERSWGGHKPPQISQMITDKSKGMHQFRLMLKGSLIGGLILTPP
jgi:hypothetical protein